MKKAASLCLRLVFVVGCLVYAFWGIDYQELAEAFTRFDSQAVVVTTLLSIAGYWLMAVRMNFLSGFTCGNWVGLKAFLLSMAVNNVAPAKLGELAKAFYLRRECGFTLSRSISMVFWERFFDLNAILAMSMVVAIRFNLIMLFLPLALGVGAIWAFLFFIRTWPDKAQRIVTLIPFERAREFILEVKLQLIHGVTMRYLMVLGLYTAMVWVFYAVPTVMVILWVAGLKFTLGQALAVFILSAVGMALPSSPGAVGVFEAAVIFALNQLFKVDKETALAIGFLLHMIQFVPTTLAGLVVLAKSGLKLKNIRQSEDELA